MIEVFRALRLGVINLFGIAVPGFILILISFLGVLFPLSAITSHISKMEFHNFAIIQDNPGCVIITIIILSYVAGYILRLSSPDELDKVSAIKVLAQLNESEKAVWPYQNPEGEEKYPYYHMYDYLNARGLDYLLYLATWGPDINDERQMHDNREHTKRSKTAVNKMKMDVSISNKELSAAIESNEAHVRLMSGTWLSINATLLPVWIGSVISFIGLLFTYRGNISISLILSDSFMSYIHSPNYLGLMVVSFLILISMYWARNRIESLFHYRRVGELVFIIMAADKVNKQSNDLIKS
ncbi:MAG: hypothetical protein JW763_05650 [candidate division Zixibacteria bacterium]|nr:hypothetical protein [candidate division Zixibacteria bacterium]